MTRFRQSRTYWVVPCALTCALLTGVPQLSEGADDSLEWLQKMNKALATRNYEGTFFHLSEGRV
jgi:negative regulator of sigma E activity